LITRSIKKLRETSIWAQAGNVLKHINPNKTTLTIYLIVNSKMNITFEDMERGADVAQQQISPQR
jgi:hypothetical protein